MELKAFLNWCLDHWSFTVFALGMFVDLTPFVKFRPIRALLRVIGKLLTGDLQATVDALSGKVTSLESTIKDTQGAMDENEKDRIRYEVLDFANSCRNGRRHTKEEFDHIITLNGKYKKLLEKTGDENGVFSAAYDYITRLRKHCEDTNDFLK